MRHRAPPPPSRDLLAVRVIAVTGAALVVASLGMIANAAAPKVTATAASAPPAETSEVPGPLAIPSIGATGAWDPDEPVVLTSEPVIPTRSAPIHASRTTVGGTRTATTPSQPVTEPLVAILETSEPPVPTPAPTLVAEPEPEPTPAPVAAATTTATVTPEPTITAEPTPTVEPLPPVVETTQTNRERRQG